jgi:elongation factor Ts
MAITAALVKEVRERTGAGMMECKKALVEADGNIDSAIEALRIQGQAKADKKAGRVAAEGLVAVKIDPQSSAGVIVEVNCETDFVTKKDEFRDFVDELANLVLQGEPRDVEALSTMQVGGRSVEETRRDLIAVIGENITIRRFARIESTDGAISDYVHNGRIGVLVSMTGGDEQVGRDLAMHVSWGKPLCLSEADVPQDELAKEKAILVAQAAESGKPPEIVEKMVEGRLKKYLKEITLLGQPFVKDPDQSVQKYLAGAGATAHDYVRFEVGEGIEKKADNFAEEVMAQVRENQ